MSTHSTVVATLAMLTSLATVTLSLHEVRREQPHWRGLVVGWLVLGSVAVALAAGPLRERPGLLALVLVGLGLAAAATLSMAGGQQSMAWRRGTAIILGGFSVAAASWVGADGGLSVGAVVAVSLLAGMGIGVGAQRAGFFPRVQ